VVTRARLSLRDPQHCRIALFAFDLIDAGRLVLMAVAAELPGQATVFVNAEATVRQLAQAAGFIP